MSRPLTDEEMVAMVMESDDSGDYSSGSDDNYEPTDYEVESEISDHEQEIIQHDNEELGDNGSSSDDDDIAPATNDDDQRFENIHIFPDRKDDKNLHKRIKKDTIFWF